MSVSVMPRRRDVRDKSVQPLHPTPIPSRASLIVGLAGYNLISLLAHAPTPASVAIALDVARKG